MLLQGGRVMVELSNVDHVLGFIYGVLGDGPPGERWQVYSKMRTFDQRLKAINRAVLEKVTPAQLELWRKAYGMLTNSRKFRNRVAHLGMRRMVTSDRKNLGVELQAPWYLPRPPGSSLKIADVRNAADLLLEAKADLWTFINTVAR
jgi:hypothetical protein